WATGNGLAASGARFVFEDRERNLWIGTNGGGLQRFRPRLFNSIGGDQGLPERAVHSVWPLADGGVLVGTYGGGVVRAREGKVESAGLPGRDRGVVYVQ